MLQKLFNSPWFVGGLAALAVLYVAITIVLPGIGGPANAALTDAPPPLMLDDEPLTGVDRLTSLAMRNLPPRDVAWPWTVERDPFGDPNTKTVTLPQMPSKQPVSRTTPSVPRVDAIFLAASTNPRQTRPRAVVEGQLVAPGDTIGAYRIVEITPEYVAFLAGQLSLKVKPGEDHSG